MKTIVLAAAIAAMFGQACKTAHSGPKAILESTPSEVAATTTLDGLYTAHADDPSKTCQFSVKSIRSGIFAVPTYQIHFILPADIGEVGISARDMDRARAASAASAEGDWPSARRKFVAKCPSSATNGSSAYCDFTMEAQFFRGEFKVLRLGGAGQSGPFGGISFPPPFSLYRCEEFKRE